MTNLFLFHRDLRIVDNTALIHQFQKLSGSDTSVLPIFIFTPEQIDPNKNKYFSNHSVQFMIESLLELSDDIEKLGGCLLFFYGHTLDVLKHLHSLQPISTIAYNIDYTPYATKRDTEIRNWTKQNHIVCYEREDYPLFDIMEGQTLKKDGTPFKVFTPFKNHCLTACPIRQVDRFYSWRFDSKKCKKYLGSQYYYPIDKLHSLYNNNPYINVHGGRRAGLAILKNASNWHTYDKNRDKLTYKTTFLSAYNHFSTVSIREVYNAFHDNDSLINELIWRDFYMNITLSFPYILDAQISRKENMPYKLSYTSIKWKNNPTYFKQWCQGQTGFPVVDAAMTQLNTTGFMHNRARMIVASFLTKDLHIDWRWGEQYFASKLVDYDAMSNSGGWQWSAGCGTDAQPWFRIFNPWTQSEKFDPDCEYIKKWIPALKTVPSRDIHKWYDKSGEYIQRGSIQYIHPIVQHDIQRKITLEMLDTQ